MIKPMNNFNHIQQIICIGEGLLPETLQEKTRKTEIVFARQAIMYFQRKTSKDSWARIATYFGFKHCNAMHSVKAIQNLIDTDRKTAAKMTMYANKINALIEFENNIILDKIDEIKELIRIKIESNDFLGYELVTIYNNLTEKKKRQEISDTN